MISTSASIPSVAFSANGRFIAAGDAAGALRMYDKQLRNVIFNFNCVRDVRSFVLALHGGHILAACGNNIVSIDRQDGSQVSTLTGHISRINAIAYSPDPTSNSEEGNFTSAEESFFRSA